MSFPRYPAYKDSGVEWLGEIPAHWGVVGLGRISTSRCDGPFGSSLKSEHYTETGAQVVRLQNIRAPGFDNSSAVFVDLDRYKKELTGHEVASGDLLIAGLGDETNPVGRACVAPDWIGPAMVKADCFRFRMDASEVEARFAALVLCTSAPADAGILATGSTRSRISLSAMANRKIPLPPLAEQITIVEFTCEATSGIDGLITEQERLIELLTEKRQAVISHAVTKGLNPAAPMKESGFEWLGKVPAHWEVRRIKTVSKFLTSGPRGWSDHISDSGELFIQSGDLDNARTVDFQNAVRVVVEGAMAAEASRTKLCDGDVVVCITGAKTGNVAFCETVPEPAYINQHLCLVRPDSAVMGAYLAMQLKGFSGQIYFERSQYGLKQGLSLDDVKNAPVLLPPISEQIAIIASVRDATMQLDALIAEATRAIELLQERRSALISAAVTGKIDVRPAAQRTAR